MAEETIWSGTSSQVKNFWLYVSCILVVPIPWAIWAYLSVLNRVYTLTTERLLIRSGVFSKTSETLELYRVRDLQVTEPFWHRLFGLKNIALMTSDTSTPEVVIDYIPTSTGLAEKLREHVELCRVKKRVREIDIE
ncbi:MAG: PH domain-containing protein [Verrucomicrobiota bacterium]|nr:PH domain-containing protein [Verrucomicrobiota bacterium]